MTLAIGIQHNGHFLAGVEEEPYKSAKGKRNFVPLAKLLLNEVQRHAE